MNVGGHGDVDGVELAAKVLGDKPADPANRFEAWIVPGVGGFGSGLVRLVDAMRLEPDPVPRWIVCGAGTGGTSATIGRYLRYRRLASSLCVADPEPSVFHRHWHDRTVTAVDGPVSCIEGIGRPAVEPSFLPEVIDRMIAVPDVASIAAMQVLSERLGRRCGASTGTNFWACAILIGEMAARGETGSVVSLLCDPGERYLATCFDAGWLQGRGFDLAPWCQALLGFLAEGRLAIP